MTEVAMSRIDEIEFRAHREDLAIDAGYSTMVGLSVSRRLSKDRAFLLSTIRALQEENERLREALEWALDNAGTDHPHYPYREDDKWTYPYLISGTPLGGGVGNALFDTAAGAVRAALKEPTHDQD